MNSQKMMDFTIRPLQIISLIWLVGSLMMVYSCSSPAENQLSLAGEWEVALDSTFQDNLTGLVFDLTATLPGTLDASGIGKEGNTSPELVREVMLHLTRKYSYVGKAFYRNTILVPERFGGQRLILEMERVMWKSEVFIDGEKMGENNSLSVPHRYDLTEKLTPGEHELIIAVDNSRQFILNSHDMAHAYTNETQVKWNGILGIFRVVSEPMEGITSTSIYPMSEERKVQVTVDGQFGPGKSARFTVKDKNGRQVCSEEYIAEAGKIYSLDIKGDINPWSEFSPSLYTLEVRLEEGGRLIQHLEESFGFRELETKGKVLFLNGTPLFLRGTLECAIFPLTGHPPMEVQEWENIYNRAREYGLNHLRFHSWCPPEAAFEAADRLGFYLQVEAPNWNTSFGADEPSAVYIEAEAENIVRTYGNHPSFCFMSMGNEVQGDLPRLNRLVNRLREMDDRHLYTTTTFTFDAGHGKYPEPADDFFITQYTDSGWVRGQGVFDAEYPVFNTDYSHAVAHLPVPLITHEIGQYSVFPSMKEIEKYQGVLDPVNFKAVRKDLEDKGLLHLAEDYLMSSGKLAMLLYKEEIERALKTEGISGFQLLDLRDFPGQGTALVGLLDAFWDSKGIVDGATFRSFCSEFVPLIWMEKAVYKNNESVTVSVGAANYISDADNQVLLLELVDTSQRVFHSSEIEVESIQAGKTSKLGEYTIPLNDITEPSQLLVRLSVKGTKYNNQWPIWVYPVVKPTLPVDDILVTRSFAEALEALRKGHKVLLNPVLNEIVGIEGKFVQVFWSPVHFPNQPGTMGLLMDPGHPAFRYFPTEYHSNWQWWDLCKRSKTLQFDGLELTPIIRVVDNFFKNRNLTNLFEIRAGNGKLVFSSIDLLSDEKARPEASQLQHSLIRYMNSEDFNPQIQMDPDELTRFFKDTQLK
jgi:hypothetical protein